MQLAWLQRGFGNDPLQVDLDHVVAIFLLCMVDEITRRKPDREATLLYKHLQRKESLDLDAVHRYESYADMSNWEANWIFFVCPSRPRKPRPTAGLAQTRSCCWV